jgi:hypothetical protein
MRPYYRKERLMTKIEFLKKFVQNHKVAIAITVTATAFIVMIMRDQKALNKFLDEHGLADEYYALKD